MNCPTLSSINRRSLILAAATGIALVATSVPSGAQSIASITAAYGQTSLYNAPIWIAYERGLFEEYGLDVELVQLTGARITQGLMAGSAQFVMSSASSTFLARLGGGDPLLVGSTLNRLPWDFIVTPEIESIDDIRGSTGALALRGDFTETATRLALAANDMTVDEVELVQGFGTDAERIAVLVGGSAAFSVVSHDFQPQYEEAGLRQLFSLMDVDAEFVLSGVFTTESYAEENPEVVTAFLQAIGEALHIMDTEPDYVIDITAQYSNRERDQVAPTYEFYRDQMNTIPLVTEEVAISSLRALEGANPDAATADVSEFYDSSYMQALIDDGFFEALGSE
ncbi:MAG: ABC transporter substrate-binding protein [Azospirillaceae bacterium]